MDQKNVIMAVVLSLAVLVLYDLYFLPKFYPTPADLSGEVSGHPGSEAGHVLPQPGLTGEAVPAEVVPGVTSLAARAGLSREEALASSPRITISSPRLRGSLALRGARFDDLILTDYRETTDPTSAQIVLLSPAEAPEPYYATFGWVAAGSVGLLPDHTSLWEADSTRLTPEEPVTLRWTNLQGVTFVIEIALDEDFLFTITQRVENGSEGEIALAPFGLISRTGTPETSGFYILHEGLLGVLNGKLEEHDYDDLIDQPLISYTSVGGWFGITDKYWMAALLPDQTAVIEARFLRLAAAAGQPEKYQNDFHYRLTRVAPGRSAEEVSHFFAGAKEAKLLDRYEERYGIVNFDLAVDFGWFYFLTKPIFLALHWLYEQVGNFGVAILLLTVLIKLLFFPLANRSYMAMAKLRRLQPEMLQLRERFSDDKMRLQQEMMALYKREGANPISGCLPILIQIPVFFALYKVLFVTIEMRHAPFFGWIQDLSAPDPTSYINLFGLLPWGVPELGFFNLFIHLGIWPLLMGLTMFLQQKLNPQPPDPVQARIFMLMPIVFTFLLATFPAGLVIYWTWNNLLSIAQQYTIMKLAGDKPGSGKSLQKAGKSTKPEKSAKATALAANEETTSEQESEHESASEIDGTLAANKPAATKKRKKAASKGKSSKSRAKV